MLASTRKPPSVAGKRAAIVGGGPAGMAAAYFLGRAGVACTIFEREAALGRSYMKGLRRDVLRSACAAETELDGRIFAAALEKLDERERTIITLRFGLGGGEEQTQKEVADRMGISQSYISRLEKRIIQRLKKEMLRLM